ncbi:unnamed protein product [Dracunculus medinensis]|uniref:Signal peptide peptidase-like 2B n=1 Tax=Dracunculus medinensis TaxID=318479 RepID=A0A158Q3P1_DRAME|nr:unnamed protein product [Dracunculus medinensis]
MVIVGSVWHMLLLTLFQLIFIVFSEGRKDKTHYESSYVYMLVKNEISGKERQFCVNYQQWRSDFIAESAIQANAVELAWWGGIVGNTNVCASNTSVNYAGKAVALNYRITADDGRCAAPFVISNMSFKGAIQYEVDQLISQEASVALILVDRGRHFVSRWFDYLFAEFYDPDLNTTLPTFFIYKNVFLNDLLGLSTNKTGKDLTIKFYRPLYSIWDWSMLIIWLLAVFCTGVGGFWTGRTIGDEVSQKIHRIDDTQAKKDSYDKETINSFATCVSIALVMLIVIGVLMLGFFFRPVMVFVFNMFLAIIGIFSIHRCFMTVIQRYCKSTLSYGCSLHEMAQTIFRRELLHINEYFLSRSFILSVIVFVLSTFICVSWFIFRRSPYAFILLDFINVNICLYALKGFRFSCLKWLTVLLICMFVYDIFMVFGTPLLTRNGCSVMIEVAAGTDCSKSQGVYPVAPINSDTPEMVMLCHFPMLFQVPHLREPLISCIDLEVEKDFHPVFLGLGDVIVPGYLTSFCFMADLAIGTCYLYGIVSLQHIFPQFIGYGVGLLMTFLALTLMESAQPALIYLIPFSLLPVMVLALIRKEFKILWNGLFEFKNVILFL